MSVRNWEGVLVTRLTTTTEWLLRLVPSPGVAVAGTPQWTGVSELDPELN